MLEIVVIGTPGPQGSKSYRGQSKSGHAIMVESSAKVKPWRQDVVTAARQALMNTRKLEGPVRIAMVFTLKKPKSAPKRTRTYPRAKPDLSKLARSTEDALTTAGVYEDDARIVEYTRLAKVFPGEDIDSLDVPGVRIKIWRVE